MKGLILSLLVFVLYVGSTAVAAHVLRPKGHLRLFVLASVPWGVGYFVLYAILPRDVYFLPQVWMSSSWRIDMVYGFVVFLLNCHTFVDCFFGGCGGFSVSLLIAILRTSGRTATREALVAKFKLNDHTDRIYSWRVPRMEEQDWVRRHAQDGRYALTSKGRIVAGITWGLKRLMNLGEGG